MRAGHLRTRGTRTPRSSRTTTSGTARISFTIFLRRALVERVGDFDERLGLGSPEPWASGEEIDYLIRAVRAGARIAYDPSLVVRHAVREDDARVGARDGASVGYLLRKHDYPARVVARMLVRPLGGALVSARGSRRRSSAVPACDLPRSRTRLPRCEAGEDLSVTVEPGREREPLDRATPRRVARRRADRRAHARRLLRAPRPQAARRARSCPDAERRSRPRRRRARARLRCGRRRPASQLPSPRSRDSGTDRSPSCAGGGEPAAGSPGAAACEYRPSACTRPRRPSRSTIGSTGVARRPVTRSCASGCVGTRAASVSSPSSSRYAWYWSPPRSSTGPPLGGCSDGVKCWTSTALCSTSHDPAASHTHSSAARLQNSLW